jgi:hypothetical protein
MAIWTADPQQWSSRVVTDHDVQIGRGHDGDAVLHADHLEPQGPRMGAALVHALRHVAHCFGLIAHASGLKAHFWLYPDA